MTSVEDLRKQIESLEVDGAAGSKLLSLPTPCLASACAFAGEGGAAVARLALSGRSGFALEPALRVQLHLRLSCRIGLVHVRSELGFDLLDDVGSSTRRPARGGPQNLPVEAERRR